MYQYEVQLILMNFYAPLSIDYISYACSFYPAYQFLCQFLCLSTKNSNTCIGNNFGVVNDKSFIFHMCIP